jgi:predicted metal-dependent HD superfamily phosphohydrolase
MAGDLESRLREEWHRDLTRWGAGPGQLDEVFADLVARYREPHRHHHDLSHVAGTLRFADALVGQVEGSEPAAIRLAIWYHDAVYDPRATDNEDRSAVLAAAHLSSLGVGPQTVTECARLVQCTADHRVRGYDPNATVLVDADLAVLSSGRERYDRYVAGVRAEYAHLDDEAFRRGRADLVASLLARRNLYRTHLFRTEREPRARANLERELAGLQAGADIDPAGT